MRSRLARVLRSAANRLDPPGAGTPYAWEHVMASGTDGKWTIYINGEPA